MRTIDSKKIVGVKIWENETDALKLVHGYMVTDNSMRIIEFKSVEDVDKLIKELKEFKKEFNLYVKYGPSLKGDEN